MIFLTVGTILPFDRLVWAVDEAVAAKVITTPVLAQIGRTGWRPRHLAWVATLEKAEFDRKVAEADFVISHAGMGSIMIALEHGKRLLAMPRRKCYREAVNDHQVACARRFAEMGHLLVAADTDELPQRLREMEAFVPAGRVDQADQVTRRIAQFLEQVEVCRGPARWRTADLSSG
jgi:UDP-N-acetylglucosamine transferase subunit ALG13